MNLIQWTRHAVVLAASLVLVVGCAKSEDKNAQAKNDSGKGKSAPSSGEDGKHGTWWCDEHGVPEAECSMCSSKVAKDCKAKGDWCKEHNRAKSQCFICDGTLAKAYADRYRDKYGKEPPAPEENMPKKGDK